MNISEIFNGNTLIPECIHITNIGVIIKTNQEGLDLKDIFDNVETSNKNIQLAKYKSEIKYADKVSRCNTNIINKYNKLKTANKSISHFHNMICLFFDTHNIRLFKNGTLHITGKNNSLIICDKVNTVINLLKKYNDDVQILSGNIINICYNIKLNGSNAQIRENLKSAGYTINDSFGPFKFIKHNDNKVNIFNNGIGSFGFKSFEDIINFYNKIKNYVDVDKNRKCNDNDNNDNNDDNDDEFLFEIDI